MLRIPLTVQNLDHRRRPFTRRLRATLGIIVRSQVRHREPRTIRKDLEPQLTVVDRLARCDHVQRRLARTVLYCFEAVPARCRIEAQRDGAPARADIDDAWRAVGFLEERREGFEHQKRARSVGLEALRHLLRDRTWGHGDGGIVDERV